jgi:hypothetical protein
MKSSPSEPGETLWQRFRDDDRSTLSGRCSMVLLALWLFAQGVMALS